MSEETKPKIIVDEDWKTQVEREKAELERQRAAAAAGQDPAAAEAPRAASEQGIPEPGLEWLVSMMASEAMLHMGVFASPATGKPVVDLPAARLFIDTLGVLEEKTRGNRTPQEDQLFSAVLHDLRMGYLEVERATQAAPSYSGLGGR